MIAQLTGTVVRNDDLQVVLDVGGVGYGLSVSGRTRDQLATSIGNVTLQTELHVREDIIALFGFLGEAERTSFRLLLSVQGVGAKAAMAILTVLSPDDLSSAILAGDKAMVSRADGIGPKIAQRVVNELKEKVWKFEALSVPTSTIAEVDDLQPGKLDVGTMRLDAISALVNLGYGRSEAYAAVQRTSNEKNESLSGIISKALQELAN